MTEHPPIFGSLLNEFTEANGYTYSVDSAPMTLARCLHLSENPIRLHIHHRESVGWRPPGYDLDEHSPYL